MKTCNKCKIELQSSSFNKDKSSKDGLYKCCKDCHKKRTELQIKNNYGKLVRNCPSCNEEIVYKYVGHFNRANTSKSCCEKCSQANRKNINHNVRNCPVCCKKIKYKSVETLNQANRTNRKCKTCKLNEIKENYNKLIILKDEIISKYSNGYYSVTKLAKEYNVKQGMMYSFIKENTDYLKREERLGEYSGPKEIGGNFMSNCEYRAKVKNLEYNIDKEYVVKIIHEQKYLCALSGLPIHIPSRSKEPRTASVDRIDSNLGYIIGNIRLVNKDLNRIRLNLSDKEFFDICKKVTIKQVHPKINPNVTKLKKMYWNMVVRRASERDIKVLITLEEALKMFNNQSGRCALTGDLLNFPVKARKMKLANASLDRIDSNKDYSIDNCQWVTKTVNTIKWDFSQEQFKEYCSLVYNHLKPIYEPDLSWS